MKKIIILIIGIIIMFVTSLCIYQLFFNPLRNNQVTDDSKEMIEYKMVCNKTDVLTEEGVDYYSYYKNTITYDNIGNVKNIVVGFYKYYEDENEFNEVKEHLKDIEDVFEDGKKDNKYYIYHYDNAYVDASKSAEDVIKEYQEDGYECQKEE